MTPDPATGSAPPSAESGDTRPLRPQSPTTHTHDPVLLPADAPAVPGYDVLEEVGRGGMGVVYKARQVTLNRVVALKAVAGTDPKGLIRFLAEAEAAAAVDHPHVVRVFESGEAAGRPFLVMEYLPGGTLGDRLRAGRLAARAAADLVAKLARGVQAAHDQGIVHRDLKPANVLFDEPGEPKVSDFGLAKRQGGSDLTKTLAIMGTPAYMAPEQAAGRSKYVGPPADVWALGVILYECLTGSRPFAADDPWEILRQIRDEDPPPPREAAPGTPLDLELVCLKCLAKDPADRYPTAAALADDLGRFLAGETVSVRAAGWVERGYRWARRRPYQVAAGLLAGLVVFLGAFGGAAGWLWVKADAARHAAESERAVAETERQRAEAARDGEATARAELAGVSAARSVDLAHREWLAGNLRRAADLLADCPPPLRNWEWRYVDGLCNSHLRVIDPATAVRVAVSTDGRWLTTSGLGGSVTVRDARTDEVRGTLRFTNFAFAGAAEDTPAGLRVGAVGGGPDRKLFAAVWDPVSGKEVARLTPTGRVPVVNEVSAGGGRVTAYAQGGEGVDVWDLATGRHVFATRPDPTAGRGVRPVRGAALSPDGARLAVVEYGGTVRVWDPAAGRVEARIETGTDYTLTRVQPTPAFGRGAALLAVNTAAGVGVWDAATGKRLAEFPLAPRTTNALAFSADGRRLAALRDGTVHVWDATTFAPVVTLRVGVQLGIALSPDGRRLFTAGATGVREWDATDEQRATTYRPLAGVVSAGRFTPGGPAVVRVAGTRTTVRHLTTGAEVGFTGREQPNVRGHLLSPDGKRLVRVHVGGEVELLDPATGRRLAAFTARETRNPPALGTVAFSPDGRLLLHVGPDGEVTTRDADTGAVLKTAHPPPAVPATPAPPAGPADPLARALHAVAFGPAGPRVVSSRVNGPAVVWDPDAGAVVCELDADPHAGRGAVEVVRFTPDGTRLAAWDAVRVTQFDPATGKRLAPPVAGGPAFAFTPDGTRVATATPLSVTLWDPATGRECLQLRADDAVRALAFGPDGRTLLVVEAGAARVHRTDP